MRSSLITLRRGPHGLALGLLAASALACASAGGSTDLAAQNGEPDPGPPAGPGAVLDSIVTSPPLHRAHWGVAVYELATGSPVLLHNNHRLFTAASTMKLLTAAAALDLLGPDFRYETAVELSLDAAGRAERLVVHGSGDPSLNTAFHADPLAPLDSLADSLAAAGLRHLTGPIIIDQSRFDSTLVHPAWERFDLDWYYAAPVAPMAVMGGAYEVVVRPGVLGGPATVTVPHGAELVAVDARIRTVSGSDDWDDVLRRFPDRDSLVLRGTIGIGAGPDTSWIAQTDPGRVVGRALRLALERAGIRVDGDVAVRYGTEPTAGGVEVVARGPAGAGAVAESTRPDRVAWRSPPLQAIIRLALEQSDNWVTEQVLKTLAATFLGRGDWNGGTDLVEQYVVETVGVEPEAVHMRDGSGLTPQGLLSPDAVVAVLRHVHGQPWGPAFRDALASPGEPESTLENRLPGHGSRLAAKTGTLRHVNALSGFLRTLDGRELVFSILSNGSGRPSWEVQTALDRIVESLITGGS